MVIKREIIGGLVIFDAEDENFYTSLSINLPPGHLEDQENLDLGMSQEIQNMSNRIFKHWFSKDEYHFGDWKLNRDTENKDKEGILCPTGIANITLPCNNYCNNLNCTLGYTVNNYIESYLNNEMTKKIDENIKEIQQLENKLNDLKSSNNDIPSETVEQIQKFDINIPQHDGRSMLKIDTIQVWKRNQILTEIAKKKNELQTKKESQERKYGVCDLFINEWFPGDRNEDSKPTEIKKYNCILLYFRVPQNSILTIDNRNTNNTKIEYFDGGGGNITKVFIDNLKDYKFTKEYSDNFEKMNGDGNKQLNGGGKSGFLYSKKKRKRNKKTIKKNKKQKK